MLVLSCISNANALDIDGGEKDCDRLTYYIEQTDRLTNRRLYTKSINDYNQLIALAEVCLTRQAPEQTHWFKQEDGKKLNSLYNKIALTHLALNQPYKANLYLALANHNDPTTAKNKKLVNQRLAKTKHIQNLTGTYWQYAGFGIWNNIHIKKASNNTWQLDANLFHIINPFIGAINTGRISSILLSQYDQLNYINHNDNLNCEIGFRLDHNKITVNRSPFNHECGFGSNVYAEGIYYRVETE